MRWKHAVRRGRGLVWFAAAGALAGCQLLFGIDASDLPEPDEKGAAGASRSGGAGGSESGGGGKGGASGSAGAASGGSGGSGGSVSNLACSSTSGSHEECRDCCRTERRGNDENLDLEVIEEIEACLCADAPSCEGLSGDCADCCEGICAGLSGADNTFSGRCSSCLLGGGCPGLNLVCSQQSRACSALFSCFHDCQQIDP